MSDWDQKPVISNDREGHAYVKLRLELMGQDFNDIAEALGVTESAVSGFSRGASSSRRIGDHIAKLLGEELGYLYPERYGSAKTSTKR